MQWPRISSGIWNNRLFCKCKNSISHYNIVPSKEILNKLTASGAYESNSINEQTIFFAITPRRCLVGGHYFPNNNIHVLQTTKELQAVFFHSTFHWETINVNRAKKRRENWIDSNSWIDDAEKTGTTQLHTACLHRAHGYIDEMRRQSHWFSIAFSFYPNETITLNATSALYARQMPNNGKLDASHTYTFEWMTRPDDWGERENVSATGEKAFNNRIKWIRICALLHLDGNREKTKMHARQREREAMMVVDADGER